jgi:hypothetical protein
MGSPGPARPGDDEMHPENVGRYDGKPFLRMLELYVLWCIGKLTAEYSGILEAITPKLRRTYSMQGNWYEIVERVMELPHWVRPTIVQAWQSSGEEPEDFAMSFVDRYF